MQVLYHGTNYEVGKEIIRTKYFRKSLGDRHWLGDGVYFYSDKSYAFRWIYISYRRNNKADRKIITGNSILEKYTILSADIEVDKSRIFDLVENAQHNMLFNRVFEKCSERYPEKRDRILDGVVLNIMFKKMRFAEKYDIIRANFIHENNDIILDRTRMNYFPEVQYCVVNREIIVDVKETEVQADEMNILFDFAKNYNSTGNSNLITYNPKGRYKHK